MVITSSKKVNACRKWVLALDGKLSAKAQEKPKIDKKEGIFHRKTTKTYAILQPCFTSTLDQNEEVYKKKKLISCNTPSLLYIHTQEKSKIDQNEVVYHKNKLISCNTPSNPASGIHP
ncbi:hypothetical protein O6H91_06G099400 [Diphasiastrum complanatum]|uniref:Uncharacterized protein n=1 Tax=Diphasiastrum complanatum TaxID=34168 RepID=A0ACC2DGQ0_DIPCM|nr:hypothetical protein O6H91_Y496300 [Diphasiastrum complanatum]KAJ7553467.1 hypothetical protein O6H91_06G099400 [Diphasiastrum complanatum]